MDPLGLIQSGMPHQPTASRGALLPQKHNGPSFKEALVDEIRRVNELQQSAEQAVVDLASGRRDDIENVMLATQEADTAFRMLLQVRNKVMDAYEEVKQIRI